MKLVIGGATGFCGREVLRQALRCPQITSVVTIGRRPVVVKDQDTTKLTDIVMEDGTQYSDSTLETIADATACIWTTGVTLSKSKTMPFDEVKKVTRDYTITAIDALCKTNKTGKPLMFIYYSGMAVTRDLNHDWEPMRAIIDPKVAKMRCMLEVELVEYAEKSSGSVEGDSRVSRPDYQGRAIPEIERTDLTAAVLKQGLEGIEKDPLTNEELVQIGKEALPKYG
ncbi:uncharacterized protein LY89DRAFT_721397 [Mollisia scopiformis]|uniref:NAD(P)-binding domain-containing protein n=1 Tax=Mollisia scopiformis TaxID=149040 RepID=A0A194X0H7_MOLSC|nr:uncharacterized protein LY89DRAFT_721397 [Mollisia scopiformis]KUJ13372.1 hypothetical protein LY89DRAFT_721397 [Mollisia scopiformis]